MKKITIDRTEQWEYTAYGYDMEATGSSEMSAELNLLRKVINKIEALENYKYKMRQEQMTKKQELKDSGKYES